MIAARQLRLRQNQSITMSNMAKVHAELHPSVQERLEKVQNVQKSDEVVESSGPKTLTLQEFRQAILLHRKETNYPLLTAFNDIKFIIPGKTVDVPVSFMLGICV